MPAPTVDTELMNEHLRFIGEAAGPDRHVVPVLDNAGRHVAKALRVPGNVTLFPLPACSPELNPVERVWHWMRSHYLSNRIHLDYDELFAETRTAWNRLDEARLRTVCATGWLRPAN